MWPENTYVLIPSYRAMCSLKKFLPVLENAVPAERIFIVDDASLDGTAGHCRDIGISCISHEVNRGKGAALQSGFEKLLSKGASWIITMDADGQHSPADLGAFLELAAKNPDTGIGIGARNMRPGVAMPLARICSNVITSRILTLFAGVPILDSQCGYRIYSSAFLKKIRIEHTRFEMESEVILKAAYLGFPVRFVRVQTLYLGEQSHISHIKDTTRWVKAVLSTWWKQRFPGRNATLPDSPIEQHES